MGDDAVTQPALKLTTTIDIESSGHGVLRFRRWLARDSAAIRKLCAERLGAREFAERLLAEQAIEPILTADEIKAWDDAELASVAKHWWDVVD
jgi:hypothetical protein